MIQVHPPFAATHASGTDLDLATLARILKANRLLIVASTVCFAIAGIAYAYLASPQFESNVMLSIDDHPEATNSKSMIDDVSSISTSKPSTAAESQILASRAVVARAVDQLHLYIDAKPRRFPVIGGAIGRAADRIGEPGVFGMGGFAWGNESIDITKMEVPTRFEGKKFTLTLHEQGEYSLDGPAFDTPVTGRVDQPAHFATPKGPVDILVANVTAHPGTEFIVYRNSTAKTIELVQRDLNVQEKVKDSGIVVASLRGYDPVGVSDALKEIAQQYIRQNTERKSLEASNSLVFLQSQLPTLKAQLDRSQQNETDLHKKARIVDLSEEARQAITQMGVIKAQLLTLQQQRRDLANRFVGNDFPAVKSIDDQIKALEIQQDTYSQQLARFPDLQQKAARSDMQVKVDTALYTTLLNNAQQLELVKAGKVGTVRMIDTPVVPEDPVFPKKPIAASIGALLGLVLGIIAAFTRNAILRGINDPGDIERTLGLNVYAMVPFSKQQKVMLKTQRKEPSMTALLADSSTADPAVESLRELRMVLSHGLQDISNKVVLMTGATPGVGKSFISANFAKVLAMSGKRVLLIDADLRNGHLHRHFGLDTERGLADYLNGGLRYTQIVHKGVTPNLDFVSTGTRPHEPGELLLSPKLGKMLESYAKSYDMIVIDSPPILAVSDASILAQTAGTLFVVARSDVTRLAELEECAKRMSRSGATITGVIFNGSTPNHGYYGYGTRTLA